MSKKAKKMASFIVALILVFSSTNSVFATDFNEEKVRLTEDLAIQMAENFVSTVNSEFPLTANNPIKFYDESGQAIGYIVNFYNNTVPYGYVIFDTTNSSIISEYSVCENAKNPYEVIQENTVLPYRSDNNGDEKLYKISPFTYGLINNEGKVVNNYGETISDSKVIQDSSRSVEPSTWNDIFISIQDIYEKYTLVSSNHLDQFISFNQTYIQNITKHYACAVSALLACGAYYQAVDYLNIPEAYMALWEASGTNTTRVENGITYGSTDPNNIGPGLVNYCIDQKVYIMEFTINRPKYNSFTNCIDGGNIAILDCAINSSSTGQIVGHAMTVEGYTILRANNSGKNINTLMVFDGWGDNVRYVNFDFNNYARTGAIIFNG